MNDHLEFERGIVVNTVDGDTGSDDHWGCLVYSEEASEFRYMGPAVRHTGTNLSASEYYITARSASNLNEDFMLRSCPGDATDDTQGCGRALIYWLEFREQR